MNLTKLKCRYLTGSSQNPYFVELFDEILKRLKFENPEIDFLFETNYQNPSNCQGCINGTPHFSIINPENNKTIILSFWDRGMEIVEMKDTLWPGHDIVQYIGGVGIYMSNDEIFEKYNMRRHDFQYTTLGTNGFDMTELEWLKKYEESYDINKKERKVCFYGAAHGCREEIGNILEKHPLFDIQFGKYFHEDYYKYMSKCRIGLSLNGAGEICIRDSQYFALRIPIIRPLLKTQFHNKLIPNKHYLSIDAFSPHAHAGYNIPSKEVADQIISKVEESIDDEEKLKSIADSGYEYYKNFINTRYLTNLFFEIANLKLLV